MTVFDTSALVPLFDHDHPHHGEARAAFDGAEEVLLHPCVLAEFTTVLRRLGKDAGHDGNHVARASLRALLDQPRCRVVTDVDHDAVFRRYDAEAALSYADATVATLGQRVGVTAFDQHLVRSMQTPS